MKEFERGSVVQLKSGGPKMTVIRVDETKTSVECIWYDANTGVYSIWNFAPILLNHVRG